MPTALPHLQLTAKILSAYVTRNNVPAGTLPELLFEVHRSLAALDRGPEPRFSRPTEAQIRASIRPDALISFEDGKSYKALRRHLTIRGLTPEAYKAKWGLPVDYPLVSAAYSARRSIISRQIGLSQRLRTKRAAGSDATGAVDPAIGIRAGSAPVPARSRPRSPG